MIEISINRANLEYSPRHTHYREHIVLNDAWSAAGGREDAFEGYLAAIKSIHFDNLRALLGHAWEAAGGGDSEFHAWWDANVVIQGPVEGT